MGDNGSMFPVLAAGQGEGVCGKVKKARSGGMKDVNSAVQWVLKGCEWKSERGLEQRKRNRARPCL